MDRIGDSFTSAFSRRSRENEKADDVLSEFSKNIHSEICSDELALVYKPKQKTKEELNSKKLVISESGNLAEASLKLSGIFEVAQQAADEYIYNIKEKTCNKKRNLAYNNNIPAWYDKIGILEPTDKEREPGL